MIKSFNSGKVGKCNPIYINSRYIDKIGAFEI